MLCSEFVQPSRIWGKDGLLTNLGSIFIDPNFFDCSKFFFLSQSEIQPLAVLKRHKWRLCGKAALGRFAPFTTYSSCCCAVNARNPAPPARTVLPLAAAAFCVGQSTSKFFALTVQLRLVSGSDAQTDNTTEFSFTRQPKKQNTTWHCTRPVCLLETPVILTQIWLVQLGEELEVVWQGSALQFQVVQPPCSCGVLAPPCSLSSLINISAP